jgi:hypothetical protein
MTGDRTDTPASSDGRQPAQVRLELMAGEEADAVAEAVVLATPTASVIRLPGLVNISAPGALTFSCAEVSKELGRPWDTRQLQIIMANYAGYISRMDEEGVELVWPERVARQEKATEPGPQSVGGVMG